jgi:thioredoxin reductase
VFDVIVVGGGPAGLSAALMLGRCRRRVLLCDLGQPRNRRSHAIHGFLTRDGVAPAELTRLGRAELEQYGVELRAAGVTDVEWAGNVFHVALADDRHEQSRFVLIATGVVDELPLVPGLDECYGRSVFHCPYCDGWEWRGRRFTALGDGAAVEHLALGLTTWSDQVVACTNGRPIEPRRRSRLERNRVHAETRRIVRLDHDDGRLRAIAFADGERLPCDVLFFSTGQHPQSPLAVKLGCALTRRGTVRTGTLSTTNVRNVFVAGDASRDAQFAVVAAAEGVKAAVAINAAMQKERSVS